MSTFIENICTNSEDAVLEHREFDAFFPVQSNPSLFQFYEKNDIDKERRYNKGRLFSYFLEESEKFEKGEIPHPAAIVYNIDMTLDLYTQLKSYFSIV